MSVVSLKAKTISPQTGTSVEVPLNARCRQVVVKNFSDGDIWAGITPNATKTDGMIRIPSFCAQVLTVYRAGEYGDNMIDTVYILADTASENTVEVQAVGG